MPYISHGHWVGPGEPTQPAPPRARCGGPGLCRVCGSEAFAIDPNLCVRVLDAPQRRRYATRDELIGLLATHIRRVAPRVVHPIGVTEAVLDALTAQGVDVDALVKITVEEA